ncbi:MAG: hypothetical protein C6P37_10525 [Caldibacillus debilis]|uniref:Uncharacterized protein n=1 Tax=Caldibacillus debilis TaxID=301148 RepID=A0A3E0K481_9BACI|nr:MAG: hypothetical protein C6P37_10525 [Caldibacillus debilis]
MRTAETEGGRRIPPENTDAVSDGCVQMRSRDAQNRRPARPPKVLPEMRQRRKTRIVRPLIRGCAAEMATKTGRRSGDLNKQDQRVQDMGRAESVPRRDGGFRFLWEKTGRLPGKPEKIREGIRERSATPPASAMEAIGPFSRRLDRKARLDFTIRFAIGFIQLKSACRCIRPLRTGPPLRPGSSGMRLRTAGTVWPYPFP